MGKHHRPARSGTAARVGATVAAVGLGAVPLAGPAVAAPAPAAEPATGSSEAPCAAKFSACVRLSTNQAWLTDGEGRTLAGPVRMNSGSDDAPTPTGVFTVQWKDRYHVSREADASMPYAVFFDNEGRAFHAGDPARESAGCVRLPVEAAKQFFAHLEPGDRVEILP